MEKLIEFLKQNKTDFDIGIIKDKNFYKVPNPLKDKQAIRFKWKNNAIDKLISKLDKIGIILIENEIGKYGGLYNIKGMKNQIYIQYAVDSHIQLPKTLLKHFRTGDKLYFIDTTKNEVNESSAKNYNTKFGYYSLWFEEYLSKNYEKIITEIIENTLPFINDEEMSITYKNWNNKVNKLFLMSIFRSPEQVADINRTSTYSKIFAYGYEPEFIAYVGEQTKEDFIKGCTPIPIINKTKKNIVTLKSLVSNLIINGGVEAMVMPLHPKFAIAIIPNDYYNEMLKEHGKQTYILMNSEEEIKKLNKQIYGTAEFHGEDVIGIKDDLLELQELIKQRKN